MIDIAGYLVSILQLSAAEGTAQQPIVPLDMLWEQVSSLDLVEALTFISFGAVCLFYGWRVFKILVTICFGLVGLCLGIWANEQLIGGDVIWLSVICVVFFAVLSVPFMRWGITLLGAISGGVLISGAWLAAGLPEQSIWMGALFGFIVGGLVSFIIFKIAVILFTSLGGSTLLAMGVLAILYRYMVDSQQLEDFVGKNQWFLPALLLAPMIFGVFAQYRGSKGAPEWGG
jgi:hypothetical protein